MLKKYAKFKESTIGIFSVVHHYLMFESLAVGGCPWGAVCGRRGHQWRRPRNLLG